jgi:hypothetical protein
MKINKKNYLLFSIILFFFSIFLVFLSFLLTQSLILDRKEIPAFLEVGKISAFNLDKSVLSFGVIVPNTISSRTIKIENTYPFSVDYLFTSEGNISKFLVFEEKVRLLSQEEKMVTIATISPEEKDYGNYSGKIIVRLKREI